MHDVARRTFDTHGVVQTPDMAKQQCPRENQCDRIGDPQARNVWCSTMRGFKHGHFRPDVGPRRETEASNQTRAQVAENVAVLI